MKTKTIKYIRYARFFIYGVIIVYFVYAAYTLYLNMSATVSDRIERLSGPPKEYISLFTTEAQQKLIPLISEKTASRNILSKFTYDKHYRIIVYKTDVPGNTSLKDIISEAKKSIGITSNMAYHGFGNKTIEISYKPGKTAAAERLYLNFEGDSLSGIVKSDTLCYYYLKCNKFSLSYDEKGPDDFIIKAISPVLTVKELPFNVAFIRQNNSLYFVFLSAEDIEQGIPADMLLKLITTAKIS